MNASDNNLKYEKKTKIKKSFPDLNPFVTLFLLNLFACDSFIKNSDFTDKT